MRTKENPGTRGTVPGVKEKKAGEYLQSNITPDSVSSQSAGPAPTNKTTYRQRLKRILVCSACRAFVSDSWAEKFFTCKGGRHE